jgi:hypothetical protein
MPLNNDSKIIMCAIRFRDAHLSDDVIFVTNDLSCKHLAHLYFGDDVESVEEEKYDYDGYKEVYLDYNEMSEFYSHMDSNPFELLIN